MSRSTSPRRSGSDSRGAHGGGGSNDDRGDGGGGGGGGGGGRLVKVAYGRNQAEAEMLQALLSEEGIPSVLKRSGGFDNPDFLAAGPHDVLVSAQIAPRAREVLADLAIDSATTDRAELESLGYAPAAGPIPPGRFALWFAVAVIVGIILIWILFELTYG